MHFGKAVFAAMVGSLLSLIVAVLVGLIITRRYQKRYQKMIAQMNPLQDNVAQRGYQSARDPLMDLDQ